MKTPKYSVHLPKTGFPMKADLPAREPLTLARWEKMGLYDRMQARAAGAPAFVLHDGPPYANGHVHMGHALNKILKDIIVKYSALAGRRAPYIPGWDCHGLPIEHQLMKEKGWDKRRVSRVRFREEATHYAEHFIDVQRREFKRLGVLADWDHPYKTLAPEYEAGVARAFYDLLDKGFITQDKKPVYWCPTCETALAEAEVEHETKTSPSLFVKFPVMEWPPEAQALAKGGKKTFVLVWTTTPWTLPANVALAFHPEGRYRVWESPRSPDRFLVGDPGWAFLEAHIGGGRADGPAAPGRALEGLVVQNPLNNNSAPGALAEFVSNEEGTGVVHIAPGHGPDDYAVGRQYGLPVLSPVDDRGRFTSEVLPHDLAGRSVWEANPLIIDKLTQTQRLVKHDTVTHSYPHCWRCKNPIIFRAALQWFLKITDAFRARLIESVGRVRWIPEHGQERLRGMLKTRPDWCLSRQRYWGTPIPMFLCEGCGEPVRDAAVFAKVVEAFAAEGGRVWYEKDAAFFGVKPCVKCGQARFRQEQDILDVWFDSGVSWAAVLNQRPATRGGARADVMYLEGSDQHRGWFQTSLLPAVALTGEPPFGTVLTHGFVLDGAGRAMSKSEGNAIAPQDVIDKYGADVVRLWVAVTDYRDDVRLSPHIVDRVVDSYRKIRNTLRFLLGNLGDFRPAEHALPLDRLETLDLAALNALNKLVAQVTRHYERREFHLAAGALADQFCINTLSEYYLDVRKDVLYCDAADTPRRRSAQTAFRHIARALARALAPVLSFTAEETWQTLREQGLLDPGDDPESVFLNPFPTEIALPRFHVMGDFLAAKRSVNEALEKARAAGTVKTANDAAVTLSLHAGQAPFAELSPEELASVLGVARVEVVPAPGPTPLEARAVAAAPGAKCARCWLWRELSPEGLCARCADAERRNAAPAPR